MLKSKVVIFLLASLHVLSTSWHCFSLTKTKYMIMEYCVGELQEMLESVQDHKFPIWQAHR